MNSIKTYLNSLGRGVRVFVLSLAVIFVGAGIAQAATTISTSILTNGTLKATGVTTLGGTASTTVAVDGTLTTPSGTVALFLGGASTTQFTLLSGDTIKNTTASTTVISGALQSTGGFTGTTGTFSSTLGVTSLATLSGGASTTQITFNAGDTIKNASASSTAISGNLTVGGGTGSATLTVTNTASATSTATVGCIVTTATSSATSIRLMFNDQATTTTLNGNTVRGVVLWGYGSSCAN